jgi:hypothetical protein
VEKRKNKSFEGLILGAVRISVKPEDLIALLNILLELGESYRNICKDKDDASVDLSYPSAIKAVRRCCADGIEVNAELYYGIPYIFSRLLKRPGIIAGIVASIVIISLAGSVIWDVRVECEGAVSAVMVKEMLSDCIDMAKVVFKDGLTG